MASPPIEHQHYEYDPEEEYERLGLSDDLPVDPMEDGDIAWDVTGFRDLWGTVSGNYDLCCIEAIESSAVTFDQLDEENPEHDHWWDFHDGFPNGSAVYLLAMRDGKWAVMIDDRFSVDSRGSERSSAMITATSPSTAIAACEGILTDRERAYLLQRGRHNQV